MTANQLREAIGQVEASGFPFGVLRVARPAAFYDGTLVELVPCVFGERVGEVEGDIIVRVPLAGLRHILSLVNLADAPPQGTV